MIDTRMSTSKKLNELGIITTDSRPMFDTRMSTSK